MIKNTEHLKTQKILSLPAVRWVDLFQCMQYWNIPKVFGGAGVFSPAFWVGPKIFDDIKAKGKKVNAKIYFYAGDEEGESMVPMTIRAFNEMHRVSKSKMS